MKFTCSAQIKLQQPSLPTRECGLKSIRHYIKNHRTTVTPYAGVWIEILHNNINKNNINVTPYAGVWIEISVIRRGKAQASRHSLRGSVD